MRVAPIFHVDIMDGRFVPSFAMWIQDFAAIRHNTSKMVDDHLMIESPVNYIQMFAELGADIIYIHPEADTHVLRTLDKIHCAGKKAGIALNPGTSVATVSELFAFIEYLLVMTVNPGFADQKFIGHVVGKIKEIAKCKDEYAFQLIIDGALLPARIMELDNIGVDGFVLGTSSLFRGNHGYASIMADLKNSCRRPVNVLQLK